MKKNRPPTHKTVNQRMHHSFKRFRLGLALFFFGFVILYTVDQLMGPSLYQEVMAGVGVLVIAAGFGLAVVAELLFIAYRVWSFFSSK